jgi:hypothetical protein
MTSSNTFVSLPHENRKSWRLFVPLIAVLFLGVAMSSDR